MTSILAKAVVTRNIPPVAPFVFKAPDHSRSDFTLLAQLHAVLAASK